MMLEFEALLGRFPGLRVAVVGEAILDAYHEGAVARICREAPVPVLDVRHTAAAPGGAANTAANLAALGAHVSFASVVGDDGDGCALIEALARRGVETGAVVRDPARETLAKRRLVAEGQLLLRYDTGTTDSIARASARRLAEALEATLADADALVISDYDYGVMSPELRALLGAMVAGRNLITVVDARELTRYRALAPSAVKPNYGEALPLLNAAHAGDRVDAVLRYGHRVLEATNASIAAITLDRDGAVVFERGREPYRAYARPVERPRTAGAGDTYVAAFTLALAAGANATAAAELASTAAGIAVAREGTAACTLRDLQAGEQGTRILSDRAALAEAVREHRRAGRRIVFTNGCFDILHRGHVTCLSQAKALGDVLIVGLNSDASVRRLKGEGRPINPAADRAGVLAGLSSVDHVAIFEEDTPAALIDVIRPDVFVKGGDYSEERLAEAAQVRAYGGDVCILPYLEDRSTTGIVERIRHNRRSRRGPGVRA